MNEYGMGSLKIEFPAYGVLDFRVGENKLVFVPWMGVEKEYKDVPIAHSIVEYMVGANNEFAFIADRYGDSVFFFDAKTAELRPISALDRLSDEDTGLYCIRFLTAAHYYLLAYERGILCLDDKGNERWRVTLWRYDWDIERIDDSVIWCRDLDGRHWGYRIDDGSKLV